MIPVAIKKVHPAAQLPCYATSGSAGLDLMSTANLTLEPGRVTKVPTGISVECPDGYEFQVRGRSGLSLKGIVTANAPGTIDSDYRGEICCLLLNTTPEPFVVRSGDRVGQLILSEVPRVFWVETDRLSETGRGEGGFGHTGR